MKKQSTFTIRLYPEYGCELGLKNIKNFRQKFYSGILVFIKKLIKIGLSVSTPFLHPTQASLSEFDTNSTLRIIALFSVVHCIIRREAQVVAVKQSLKLVKVRKSRKLEPHISHHINPHQKQLKKTEQSKLSFQI